MEDLIKKLFREAVRLTSITQYMVAVTVKLSTNTLKHIVMKIS